MKYSFSVNEHVKNVNVTLKQIIGSFSRVMIENTWPNQTRKWITKEKKIKKKHFIVELIQLTEHFRSSWEHGGS